MRYRFGPYELDAELFELRESCAVVPAEPQVISLLLFLAENRHRMVTKDEIIEAVWDGRIVSDAAVSSRIASARRLIGDDGSAQRVIRTVHGRGFRFIASVEQSAPAAAASPAGGPPASGPARPSIAVLPLELVGTPDERAIIAEALPQEIIRELSHLRWLFVVARASSFRFAGRCPDIRRIGEALGARYLLMGTLEGGSNRLAVAVELADTRNEGVVWAERYEGRIDAIHDMRAGIVTGVVSALEVQIPLHEAEQARLVLPERLDAWSTYHLGLRDMFRFNPAANAKAANFFSLAAAKEPSFARAHAGLSFTRFQEAFLGYADRRAALFGAREAAERAVMLDPLDPFANAVMGRAHWLTGDLEESLPWFDRSTGLSPCYAQGTYARAWAETLLCRGDEGQCHADHAMALSPLDPLRYAMLATRALSHLVRGQDAEAAAWGERAAREPGAHALIAIIAAACLGAQGETTRARGWIEVARRRHPAVSREAFFKSFPFVDVGVRSRITTGLENAGLQ